MKKQLLTAAILATASMAVSAEQYWADNSLSLLQGDGYVFTPNADDDNEVTTLTIEHVSGHSWGSLFLFVDRLNGEKDADGNQFKETYAEVSPNIKLVSFENSIVKNINAAYTYEFDSNSSGINFDNHLFGFGADLAIPGMDFASATYYYADNDSGSDDHQITLTYGWSAGNFNIDGFLDWSSAVEGKQNAELNFTPQLTYNLGPALGVKNKVKVGVEYTSWHNKFGSTMDQDNISLLLKVHL